mgnify:CR=1 FL=1
MNMWFISTDSDMLNFFWHCLCFDIQTILRVKENIVFMLTWVALNYLGMDDLEPVTTMSYYKPIV